MGISADHIRHSLDELAGREPAFARALALAGYPEPRIRERGYKTLLRTIVGQQVSVAAASSMWRKLEGELGEHIPLKTCSTAISIPCVPAASAARNKASPIAGRTPAQGRVLGRAMHHGAFAAASACVSVHVSSPVMIFQGNRPTRPAFRL